MRNVKTIGLVFFAIVLVVALAFALELGGLEWMKYFEPKKENIKREVFENTQSFVHGKIQDLGKYYKEYQEGDSADKATIESVIQIQFSTFDAEKVENYKLKQFLIKTRGF